MTGPAGEDRRPLRRHDWISSRATKWGEEGAILGWQAEVVRRLMIVPLVLIGAAFIVSGGYWGVLFALGATLIVLDFIVFWAISKRMFRVTTACLGIPIGWRSAPPSSSKEYAEWCDRHGIRPYGALKESQNGAP